MTFEARRAMALLMVAAAILAGIGGAIVMWGWMTEMVAR
jgi:hypothetical protein